MCSDWSGGCQRTASSVMKRTWSGKICAAPERSHQRLAEAPLVGALQVAVGGDQRAQVLAELHVSRRTVVDRADADVEELAGDVARLLRDRLHQRVAERHPADRLADRCRQCGRSARSCAARSSRTPRTPPTPAPSRARAARASDRRRAAPPSLPGADVGIERRDAGDVDAGSQRVGAPGSRSRIAELARESVSSEPRAMLPRESRIACSTTSA